MGVVDACYSLTSAATGFPLLTVMLNDEGYPGPNPSDTLCRHHLVASNSAKTVNHQATTSAALIEFQHVSDQRSNN